MFYSDIPTFQEYRALVEFGHDTCVSLYLPTTPLTQYAEADRIALKNLLKIASDQLRDSGIRKVELSSIEEQVNDLIEDDDFWAHQANSLAVLVTPDSLQTFRLPNHLQAMVEVSDRFHLIPLLRALTFPHHAFVLALSQSSVRLLEIFPDQPPQVVTVAGLPSDAPSTVGRASVRDRSPSRRIHGSEGRNVLLRIYARQVDKALRGFLAGRHTPLILAAVAPLDSIFRSVCSYPQIANQSIAVATNLTADAELADRAREVLDGIYANELASIRTLLDTRSSQNRTTSDLSVAARAATYGTIETLLVDFDSVIVGTVSDLDGSVSLVDAPGATSYSVVDEIARRALLTGGKVLAVRKGDIPNGSPLAATLRFDPSLISPLA